MNKVYKHVSIHLKSKTEQSRKSDLKNRQKQNNEKMKKLFTTLAFLISFTLFSQYIIEVNYSKLDNTIEDKYEKVGNWNIKIDLQYDKIYLWEEGFEHDRLTFDISESTGPFYQSANGNDESYKYYQFETMTDTNVQRPIRYYVDTNFGFFIIFDEEIKKFLRFYNN